MADVAVVLLSEKATRCGTRDSEALMPIPVSSCSCSVRGRGGSGRTEGMDMIRANMTVLFLAAFAFSTSPGRADGVWSWSEEFCASATANVFDGGPVLSREGCGAQSNGFEFRIRVSDYTRPGSLGASAAAFTGSDL